MTLSIEFKKMVLNAIGEPVQTVQHPSGAIVSFIPKAYQRSPLTLIKMWNLFAGQRPVASLTPLVGRGGNENESISALFNNVLDNPDVYFFHPKPGQNPDIVKVDHLYKIVGPKHPEHNHEDPNMLDFRIVSIIEEDKDTVGILRMSFYERHFHLLER